MGLLILYWIGFYALHSLLATTWLKNAVLGRWPWSRRLYRLFYNLISVGLFIWICRYQAQLPTYWLFPASAPLVLLGYCLLVAGALVAVWALCGYGLGEFVGWNYIRRGEAAASNTLQTKGLNAWVRHPLHSGMILGLLGYLLVAPTVTRFAFVGCAVVYMLIGLRLEERKLLLQFGSAYAHYRQQVPWLVPRPLKGAGKSMKKR